MAKTPLSSKQSIQTVQEFCEGSPDTSQDLITQSALLREKCTGKRLLRPEEEKSMRVQKQKSQ